ncbi:MAG: MATE family efflux transporter [Betaproteobacteria bacterium]|nr:MATE family efflux transporter [Betaproteobacteria bacterium]
MVTGATSPLLTAPIGPTIIRLAAPNMISMLVTMATLMAEAWYVGQLGTEALAGLALGFPMMMLVMMLSAGSFGGTITGAVARLLGAGDREGAEVLAIHAVLMMLLLAGLCSAIFLLGGRGIYSLLSGRGMVLEQALAYSNVLFAGCVSLWLTNALAAIVRATGHMSVAAKCLLTGSLLQVFVAGGLVFGWGPLPGMGIAGAAAGIIFGNAIAAVLLLNFLVNRCVELRLRMTSLRFEAAPIVKLLKLGSLAAVNPISTTATVMVITGFVAHLGVDVLAGYGIGARLELLLVPMIFGFGYAFYGVSLCLYFASQGAGRVLWPVIASVLRVVVIVMGCIAVAREPGATAAQFFWVIAAALAAQGLMTGAAIRLGAWRVGLAP